MRLAIVILFLISLNSVMALICSFGQSSCGNECFYPILHECIDGRLCKIGQKVCGSKCYYDNLLHECIDGHLCRRGQKLCNGECYYPIGQKCIKREFLIWNKYMSYEVNPYFMWTGFSTKHSTLIFNYIHIIIIKLAEIHRLWKQFRSSRFLSFYMYLSG